MSELILRETPARRLVRLASYHSRLGIVRRNLQEDPGRKWEGVAERLSSLLTHRLPEIRMNTEIVTSLYGLAVQNLMNRYS